jgi:hypothetical protein
MSGDAQALLREVLALPDEERADIAAELIASLDSDVADGPAAVGELWSQEIERRGRCVTDGGGSDGEDWPTLRQRLTGDLTGG